jgi:sigma-B regulation protein RsbU (phosphoserine phosphatase)
VALFATLFLLLMSIGSVRYDNEEKAHRLTLAYERLRRYADRIARDLRRARSLQEKLLPDGSKMPLPDRLEWAWSFVPEAEVGGDYFDAAALDDSRVAILFTDVSGHGMSAALVTAIIKTAFEGWKDGGLPMTEFAQTLNRLLCNLTPTESFAAVVLATYDARTQQLSYVNCGHNPVPIRLRVDGEDEIRALDQANARILGVLEQTRFEEAREPLRSGDTVLFVTDGIIEATDEDGALYGSDRLHEYLRDRRGEAPQSLVTGVIEQVQSFTGGREQTDDRTILAFRVR